MQVHIAGAGDFNLEGATSLVDPCPLPSAAKKKGLRDKEKLFYAPMSGFGDLLYDKDAVYININDHFVQFSNADESAAPSRKGMSSGYINLCRDTNIFQIIPIPQFLVPSVRYVKAN